MEGQCDCANLQREGGHTGLWKLQSHQDDITHHEDLGKNNRPKTEGQFSFMPGRGTTDAIFAARQVIEKHREMQKALHLEPVSWDGVTHSYDRSAELFVNTP